MSNFFLEFLECTPPFVMAFKAPKPSENLSFGVSVLCS